MTMCEYPSVKPEITVSLCTHNSKQAWLNEAVQSVLNQTFENFELLIIDDGSDNVPDFGSDLYCDSRIRVIKKKNNEGLACSRNMAIEMARGKYIAMMDDDDISLPERLEKQCLFMERHSDVAVLGTWFQMFGDKSDIIKREFDDNEYYRCCLLFGNAPTMLHPSTMIRKSCLTDNNIRYDNRLRKAQDYNLWTKISRVGKCTNYNEVLFRYRVHKNQISQKLRSFDIGDYEWITMNELLMELGLNLHGERTDFIRKNYTRKDVDAFEYYQFLNDILSANRIKKVYDQQKLELRVREQWKQKILNVKNPFDLLSLYKQSDYRERKYVICTEFDRVKRKVKR